MSLVKAISFKEQDCGKKVGQTKKRFQWAFEIGDQPHLLEVINSALSGKRTVTLDSKEIFTEKNILNLKFDFSHEVEGHIIRITKQGDAVNKFDLRIDNRDFNELKFHYRPQTFTENRKEDEISDPFADFSNVAGKKSEGAANDFGDFDFDSKPTQKQQSSPSVDLMEQEQPKNEQVLQEINFATNANVFETGIYQVTTGNPNKNFDDFAASFAKEESNMINEDVFATNALPNCHNFKVLKNPFDENSEAFGNNNLSKAKPQKDTFVDMLNNNVKGDFTKESVMKSMKSAVDQAKSKVNEARGKFTDLLG